MPRKHSDDREPSHDRQPQRSKARPWNLWSVRLAILLTVLGLGLWAYAAATASSRDGSTSSRTGDSSLAADLAPSADEGAAKESSEDRAIDDAAPATFRLGASFLGGFALAFLMKKFIKTTIIILGLAAVAFFLLRRQGVVTLPWEQIEEEVSEGASWLQAQAGSMKDLLTGYLPSTGAAIFGGFVGFRKG